jgi:SAM-dependent methyltransferase
VIGIDAAERNVLVAERHTRSTGASVQYQHARPEELADQGRVFDAVISLEVVEHVADLPVFLDELARLVAPGGILVIGTLNRTIRSFVKAIVGAEYVLRWMPRGTHDWRKFVTPEELDLSLGRHGFRMVERCGVALVLSSQGCPGHPDHGDIFIVPMLTLRSSYSPRLKFPPARLSLDHILSAIGGQRRPGDEPGFLGDEKNDASCDFFRFA